MAKQSSVFGGVLLVAGTSIGAGMLGLPVMTAASGFYPTLLAFAVVWFFTTCAALAYLEVVGHFEGETNLISLAQKTLGNSAKWFAWVVYLLFLYSLMAAYTAGGTTMYANILGWDLDNSFEFGFASVIFLVPFLLMVYFGVKWVDFFNRILVIGSVLSFVYIAYKFLGATHTSHFYAVGDSKYLWFTLPLLVTSFGYQTLIPTLKNYMHGDVKKTRKVILIGSALPLLVYGLWVLIIQHFIPTWGEGGLVAMLHDSETNPADAIINALHVHGSTVRWSVLSFSFCAVTSSFIGVGLGIFDFLADGLKIKKTHDGRAILSLLTFGPPFLFTVLYPQGFLIALNYAGVCAGILLIIYPSLMAWSARYRLQLPGKYKMFGGKLVLLATLFFGIMVAATDIMQRLGWFPIPGK